MKAVILAGGIGTRISEETSVRPKPMIEIGGRPILWHIMKIYSTHGVDDFIICLGYKGYVIKEYFANYFLHMSDVTFDMTKNKMEVHQANGEPWRRSRRCSRQDASARSTCSNTRSPDSRKNLKATAAGSTAGFSSSHRRRSGISRTTRRPGNANRWNLWPGTDSGPRFATRVFGSRWTRSAIRYSWKNFGPKARRLGKYGSGHLVLA